MKAPPTLQDVARRAGVTAMTASRALRNQRHVAAATRRKILEAAEHLGYRPNPMVVALMSGIRSRRQSAGFQILAFLTAFETRDGWWKRFPTIARFHEGARVRADQLGFKLEHFWVNEPGVNPARLSQILHARGIQGVVLAPAPTAGQRLDLDWDRFAGASLEFAFEQPKLHRASNDQFETVRLALAKAREAGCSRLGVVMQARDDERVNNHYRAAVLVDSDLHRTSRNIPPLLVAKPEFPAFRRWFEAHRPDAVISNASEPLDWMRKLKVRVPAAASFIHVNLLPEMRGKFAGVDQRSDLVGQAAVDIVAGQINRNERGVPASPRMTLVESDWVDGPTL